MTKRISAKEWRNSQSRGNKFGAKKVKHCPTCGFTHDSKVEARRCVYLHDLVKAGVFAHVDVHPVVTLAHGIKWRLDFAVYAPESSGGGMCYEDVKGGPETEGFKLKRKMFNAVHPMARLHAVRWDRSMKKWITST